MYIMERGKNEVKTKELTVCALFRTYCSWGVYKDRYTIADVYNAFYITMVFVLMAGFLLGPKLARLSVIVYLCIGLYWGSCIQAGGGPAYILRPGFGFLLGFVLAKHFLSDTYVTR